MRFGDNIGGLVTWMKDMGSKPEVLFNTKINQSFIEILVTAILQYPMSTSLSLIG